MPVDLRYWWVVSSNDISNHPLSNQEQEVPLTGTKTLSSALTVMKVLGAVMRIPRERSRTAAQKQQHLSSRLSSALSYITSLWNHLPAPCPQQKLCSHPLAMVGMAHLSVDISELIHVLSLSFRLCNSQSHDRRYDIR